MDGHSTAVYVDFAAAHDDEITIGARNRQQLCHPAPKPGNSHLRELRPTRMRVHAASDDVIFAY
jgi:hypothetical protein